MDAVDQFSSTDLAKIVDDLRRWVLSMDVPALPARKPDERPQGGGAIGAGR